MDRRDFIRLSAMAGCAMAMPCALLADSKMRYVCKGEVHKDFHASFLDGVNYLIDEYGEAAARAVLEKTGTEVYRQMHRKLVVGDASELLEWWRYYLGREDGRFDLAESSDGTSTLTVRDCPALRHLNTRGIPGGKRMCWATRILNDAFCKGSPFEIVLEETGDFSCRQVLRKRKEVAQ
ncbi:MAG: twin-arginine translocation signal domain-containing protein [Kiritimatiellae bacterium]|nr:twin-arginine translocation signal domain-containing protein [Kiritimatiellia bacterium]